MPGYHGRYLLADVRHGEARVVRLDAPVLRRFIGGSGLGAWLMLELNAAACDPLAPEAPLGFVFSPLVGSPLTTSAKFAVVSKSPQTGRFNDALAGSRFAIAGKRTGHDAIVLVGRAARPSILILDDDAVRLEPAGDLWGAECGAAERRIRERFGSEFAVAVIGPAGERGVRYATISHDGRHAGRGGSGAVLGAKNIKAVAVRGTRRRAWADPEGLIAYSRRLSERSFGPATAKYRELGTASNLLLFNRLGTLPTRNFQQGSFAGAASLSAEQMDEIKGRTRSGCVACTIGCEHIYRIRGPRENGDASGGVRLEYENLFALGPLCGIDDADTVLRASRRADELGIDTISAGGTIAFAMECVARGLLAEPWLHFGNGAALLKCLELIARREGIGELLADGSRRAAEQIGQGSIAFAPQVKGLEMPGYEPRGLGTMALGLAVGTRGADHNRSGAYEVDFSDAVDRLDVGPEAARLAVATEDRAAVMDSLILCKFLRGVFDDCYKDFAEMLRLVTGWEVTADELRATARRIVAAKKLFNIRAGWTPAEDTLPERFLNEPLADERTDVHTSAGPITAERLARLITAYNHQRGWTDEGWIDRETEADVLGCDIVRS